MRIIGGNLKGKKISIPLDQSTRPLRDMVRESIFNILNHSSTVSKNIYNSRENSYIYLKKNLLVGAYEIKDYWLSIENMENLISAEKKIRNR